MDPITIAGIASAVASLAGSVYSNYKNSKNLDKQNQFNLSQWHMMNQYNQPVEQVHRLREAGINPALALGNISTGSASGSVQSGSPQPTLNPMQDIPNIVGNTMSQSMQYDMMKSQIELNKSNARKNNADAEGREKDNPFVPIRAQKEIDGMEADQKLKEAQSKFIDLQFDQMQQFFDVEIQLKTEEVESLKADTKLKLSQVALNFDELNFMRPAERRLMSSTVALNSSAIELNQQKVLSEGATRDLIYKQVDMLAKQIYAQEIENGVSKETAKARVQQVLQNLKNSKETFRLIEAQVGYVDAKKYREYVGMVCDGVGAVVDAGSAIATGGWSNAFKGKGALKPDSGPISNSNTSPTSNIWY